MKLVAPTAVKYVLLFYYSCFQWQKKKKLGLFFHRFHRVCESTRYNLMASDIRHYHVFKTFSIGVDLLTPFNSVTMNPSVDRREAHLPFGRERADVKYSKAFVSLTLVHVGARPYGEHAWLNKHSFPDLFGWL